VVPKAQEACFDQTRHAWESWQTLLSLRDTESGAFGATLRFTAFDVDKDGFLSNEELVTMGGKTKP